VRLPFRLLPPRVTGVDVVGLGLNSIDLVAVVADYPKPNSKQRLESFDPRPGGQIATALAVCARLGWKTSYLGTFGADDFGRRARANLTGLGVDVSASRTVDGATNQFAVVLVDRRTGERTVLWHRHPGLSIDPSTVDRTAVCAGRVLIVDCHETAAASEAARYAREAGMLTIVDVEKVRPGIDDLLKHIDAIIAAEQFPTEYTGCRSTGQALAALAAEFKAPLVCVTLGGEGTLAYCSGRELRTPAFPVACVDTTGAGDAFRGGFAAGCLRAPGSEIEDVLQYANAVAALNCRGLGAQGGMPTPDEVDQLLYARRTSNQ
jgi:sugar/nucleoside kinase (ribokinase family)